MPHGFRSAVQFTQHSCIFIGFGSRHWDNEQIWNLCWNWIGAYMKKKVFLILKRTSPIEQKKENEMKVKQTHNALGIQLCFFKEENRSEIYQCNKII